MRKIRIVATGGLGNQLFIWSFAHEISLSQRKNVLIYFDESSSDEFVRSGKLSELSTLCRHGIEVRVSRKFKFLLRLIDKATNELEPLGLMLKRGIGIYDESEFSKFTKISRVSILRGFFQEYEHVIHNIEPLSSEILGLLDKVSLEDFQPQAPYDFIHIRRGDYLNLKESWGVLSLNYFVKQYRADVPTIISTDDEKSIIEISELFPNASVLGPNVISELQAFKLMAYASRVVTSNSSFSWWGAILANNLTGAEIVLPSPWTRIEWPNVRLTPIPGAIDSRSEFL